MTIRGEEIYKKGLKVFIIVMALIVSMMLSSVEVVMAEDIIHTHIWATKYDKEKHWEYCTVCKKTRNTSEHKMVDNWHQGKETCHAYNYSIRVCECGYNYKYVKPHAENGSWNSHFPRLLHYKRCTSCNSWRKSERCTNEKGELGCNNHGTCSICGGVADANSHEIGKEGKCRYCKKQLIDMTEPKVEYAKDYSTVTIKFRVTPKDKALDLTGSMTADTSNNIFKTRQWTYVKNSDGSVDYTGVYTFDQTKQTKCNLYLGCSSSAATYNGRKIWYDVRNFSYDTITVWQDHTKPEASEIVQKDQTLHNTWATIKELTIKGKENLSANVTLTIKDPQTGDIIVDKAKSKVTDGKYEYKCTPPLEGPVEGRKYVLTIADELGNSSEKEFMIYKTDCRAPLIRSDKEYVKWSKTKEVVISLTDYGSGSVQTSLNNQTSYKDTVLTEGKYNAKYTFAEENYGVTEYKMYVRDGLGNAALETIKVGKVDNTKPTITGIKDTKIYEDNAENVDTEESTDSTFDTKKAIGVMLTIEAHDRNDTLNAEGSGVSKYAITLTKDTPKEEEWKDIGQIEIKEAKKYYLWIKDLAGNLADIKVINVKEDFNIEIDPEEIVVQEPTEQVPKIEEAQKEDNKEDKGSKEETDVADTDDTPKTGDESMILVIAVLGGLSLMITILVVRKRKMSR